MITLLVFIFVIGYLGIVLEHKLSIDKSAFALLTGVLCWTSVTFIANDPEHVNEELLHHLSDIASILFFLIGAMTIVELVDAHHGFDIITDRITTNSQVKLLWIISILSFFLSAVLDNLTTTIVMVTLIRKLIQDKHTRLTFAGLIVVAANAGGAWTPIGDVTTTMLWIGGQISTVNIMKELFLPSIISLVIPLVAISPTMKGNLPKPQPVKNVGESETSSSKLIVFSLGIGGLIFVPIFKTITHLPPFMGMMFSLSILWVTTELLLKNKPAEYKKRYSVLQALQKVDMPSVLFFLGILLAVSALQTAGILTSAAEWLAANFKNQSVIVILIGLLSAVVDNVPLVAATMGMYSLEQFPMDHSFWELLAFCAGTGGSILIIGSAAGVAAMGLEKIEFFWYMKRISWLALIGYFAGIGAFLLLN